MRGSLLQTKALSKDHAALEKQFPVYIQAWQAPCHYAGSSLPAPVCLLEYQFMGMSGYVGSQCSGERTLTTVNSCRQVS